MSAKLPVLAVTDRATDIGKVIVEGEFGWWCESGNIREFEMTVRSVTCNERRKVLKVMEKKAFQVLCDLYHTNNTYTTIVSRFI